MLAHGSWQNGVFFSSMVELFALSTYPWADVGCDSESTKLGVARTRQGGPQLDSSQTKRDATIVMPFDCLVPVGG